MRTFTVIIALMLGAPALAADAPTYLVSKTSPHVIVWLNGQSMKEGLRLIGDGTAKESPDMVLALVSCLADSGTRVAVLSGGFFSSTVLVEQGTDKGYRGDVDNSFLSQKKD